MTDNHDDDLLEPDPRFPDRPHTLDFARLSSAVAEQDAVAEMLGIPIALECDTDSLRYMAASRIRLGLLNGAMNGLDSATILESLYIDAFQLGVGFQKRGGHRPTEAGTAGEGSSS